MFEILVHMPIGSWLPSLAISLALARRKADASGDPEQSQLGLDLKSQNRLNHLEQSVGELRIFYADISRQCNTLKFRFDKMVTHVNACPSEGSFL